MDKALPLEVLHVMATTALLNQTVSNESYLFFIRRETYTLAFYGQSHRFFCNFMFRQLMPEYPICPISRSSEGLTRPISGS